MNLDHCNFLDNKASEEGGGVYTASNVNNSNDNLFVNNQAQQGGGIYQQGSNLNISRNTFIGNQATDGGGVYAPGGNLNIIDSTLSLNAALSLAGGIYEAGNAYISRCTCESNQAEDGGALLTVHNVTLLNSTLYNNQANSQGGGILSLGNTTTINSTFYGNGVLDGRGLKNGDPAKFPAVKNMIIAGSTRGGNCGGLVLVSNYGNNIDSSDTCNWGSDKGSMSNTDPALMPLADNGGPTKTSALKPGSPAINGVVFKAPNECPATDQQGIAAARMSFATSGLLNSFGDTFTCR